MDWPLPLWRVLGEELKELRPGAAKPTTATDAGNEFLFVPDDIPDDNWLTSHIGKRWPELKAGLPNEDLESWKEQGNLYFLNKLLQQKELYQAFPTVPESQYVEKQNLSELTAGELAAIQSRFARSRVRRRGPRSRRQDAAQGGRRTPRRGAFGVMLFRRRYSQCNVFLGVVQALARNPLPDGECALEKIDYLSTVSGGGYLGGWLAAWTH